MGGCFWMWYNMPKHSSRGVQKLQKSCLECKKVNLKNFTKIPSRSATLFKRDPITDVFLWFCEIFKSSYFEKHLRTAASEYNTMEGIKTPEFVRLLDVIIINLNLHNIAKTPLKGGSRTAVTSKMERFVIIVNGCNYYHKALHFECQS